MAELHPDFVGLVTKFGRPDTHADRALQQRAASGEIDCGNPDVIELHGAAASLAIAVGSSCRSSSGGTHRVVPSATEASAGLKPSR